MIDTEALRKKIIELAIQGKLTEQLPSDGDAKSLYTQVLEEKNEILKIRGGRQDKSIKTEDEDKPFEIPSNWKWIRFGEVGLFKKGPFGSALTKSMFVPKSDNAIKIYEQQHAIKKDATLGTYYISRDYFETNMSGFEVKSGDIIVSCAGTIGETYIMPPEIEQGIINQALMRVTLVSSILSEFFLYYFDANLKTDARNESNGMAIKNIPPFDVMKNWYFPLPPFAEQKRIVEKLDTILEQVEIIDTLQQQYESDLSVLKGKIIDAGIRGKLTEQLPEDGDAEVLYAQILNQKSQLIKDGKIKKEKPLPDITADEIPFEIPKNWKWVRLRDICRKIVDGDHNPPAGVNEKTEYLMLSAQNINEDKIVNIDNARYLTEEVFIEENKRTQLEIGDVLLTIVATLGRSCVYREDYNVCFQRSVCVISTMISSDYLKRFLDSGYIQKLMVDNATGAAQPGFYLNKVERICVPLPPYAEQKRISKRIEELIQIIG